MAILLTELLEEIGSDKLYTQSLDQCITELKRYKDHNRITFGTKVEFSLEGIKEYGLVVWVDREVATAARDRLLARENQAPDEEDSQQ